MFWKIRFKFHYYVLQVCFKLKEITLNRKKYKTYKVLCKWESYHLSKFFKLGEKRISSN